MDRPQTALEELLTRHVAARAAEWFPGTAEPHQVRLHRLSHRPRATVYAVTLAPDASPQVLVKVRRDVPAGPATADPDRPTLARDPRGAAELTVREHEGLRLIEHAVTGDPRFAVVRPLDHLPEHHTLVLGYVDAPTVRDLLVRGSRFVPRPSSGREALGEELWHRVGAWVGLVQRDAGDAGRPVRQQHCDELVDLFRRYGDYLGRAGMPGCLEVSRRGAALAGDLLPERLPVAVGHGDFAPRNVFRCADGRVAVFDPLCRWAAPAYEDLARFLVGVRLLGLQVHSHGLAHDRAWVQGREQAAIDGYRQAVGADAPTEGQLRCYELLLVLDKWSALVAASRGGVGARLRGASLRLAAGYLRAQADDVLARAASAR